MEVFAVLLQAGESIFGGREHPVHVGIAGIASDSLTLGVDRLMGCDESTGEEEPKALDGLVGERQVLPAL